MKAAVLKEKQRLVVEEVPTPRPGPGQVLLRVKYCAICGSDVHRFQYGMAKAGSIMGHEYCGVIAEVGEGVTRWRVGDRVVGGGGTPPPGARASLSGTARYSARTVGFGDVPSWGGFAEYVVMPEWRPLSIPEGVSDELAVLAEPCAVAVHAVRLSRIRLGDAIAILGAGPIGLLVLQAAKAAGAGALYVSEPASGRREAAQRLGATRVFDPARQDVVSEVVSLTGGLGVPVALDCAAGTHTLQQALEMVRQAGQVVVVSLAWEDVPVLTVEWVGREVEMKAVYGSTPEDWRISLDLMTQGKVKREALVTEESFLPLDDIQAVFMGLMKPDRQVQLVVAF